MTSLRLTRAREEIGSFLSVLGGLRETRLTAILGFLVTRFPERFGELLGFQPSPLDEVSVEETHEGERYDLLIHTSGEVHVIEGKVGPMQNVNQLLRYIEGVRRKHGHRPSLTVVDDGSEFSQSRRRSFHEVRRRLKSLRFVTWAEVADTCRDIARRRSNFNFDPLGTLIAEEFSSHLKEHQMTKEPHPEIYLRDVGTKASVELYFRHHLYKCQSNFFNSARNNLYFAPYFIRKMASAISKDNLVPVGEGISFVSSVESVHVLDTQDVLEFLVGNAHPNAKEVAEIIRKEHTQKDVLVMLLGPPRLLFTSPVTKGKLNKGHRFGVGAMGSRSITFDELFAASQG